MVKRFLITALFLFIFSILLGCQTVAAQETVLYIPLDNRPINYDNVLVLGNAGAVNMLTPPPDLVGRGREPVDRAKLWSWLEDNYKQADACVISTDMLLYGGLVSSRSHTGSKKEVLADVGRLQQLLAKTDKPVYAFATVMRSAASSDSFEQPGYFNKYGNKILWLSQLADLAATGNATAEQLKKLEALQKAIPRDIIDDYAGRRAVNLAALEEMVKLTGNGYIDYLVLGRDDCTPYGFHRMDMRQVQETSEENKVARKVESFPGADELGALLLARAVNGFNPNRPSVYVAWSTPKGPGITAPFEDIPLEANVRRHIIAVGADVIDSAVGADLILAVNSPAGEPEPAANQNKEALPGRQHEVFARKVAGWTEAGKPVAVADVAYLNGGDIALMKALTGYNVLPDLAGYAGCNTAGNSIGMALAQGLIRRSSMDDDNEKLYQAHRRYLLIRLAEDWGYQSLVRPGVKKRYQINSAGQVIDAADISVLEQEIATELDQFARAELNNQFDQVIKAVNVSLPWNRLFDINFQIHTREG